MFNFLKARMATMLRTNRSLLRAARRNLMRILRDKEQLEKLQLVALKADVAAGNVESLEKDLKGAVKTFGHCLETLDTIERNTFMAEYDVASDVSKLRDKIVQIERVLQKVKAHSSGVRGLDYLKTLADARALLDRSIKDSHDEMYQQYLAIQREAKGEWGQVQNFVLSINDVMKAMDNLWNLRSEVREEQREESAIESEEDRILKLLFELDAALSSAKPDTRRTARLMTELEKLFKKMAENVAHFTKLFEHSEKAFTIVMKVSVQEYFAFGKDKQFLKDLREELKKTHFPEEDLKSIDSLLEKEFLNEEEDVKALLAAVTRGSRLVANQ